MVRDERRISEFTVHLVKNSLLDWLWEGLYAPTCWRMNSVGA